MKVVHFQRRQPADKFSIEGYFSRVRVHLTGVSDVEVRTFELPFHSRGFFRRLLNIVSAALHQSDVNHITGDVHYVALLLSRKRTLLTVHDCEVLCRLSGWKRRLVRLLWYTLPAKRVSALTVNSEETKNQLSQVIRFPSDRIHVVPVSISSLFEPSPKAFNCDCPVILQVGTKPNKNLLRLISALKGIPCRLDIVGAINEEQRAAIEVNKIQFRSFSNLTDIEMTERYRESDIVSFVSTHEGFGMPIVEAQATERICVTSNCSSMPETAGQGAHFVDPFDVKSIRQGFLKVISDKAYRDVLIEQGRLNRRRFDSAQIAEDFLAIYRTVYKENH